MTPPTVILGTSGGVDSSVAAAQGSPCTTEVDSRADLLAHLRHEPHAFGCGALVSESAAVGVAGEAKALS